MSTAHDDLRDLGDDLRALEIELGRLARLIEAAMAEAVPDVRLRTALARSARLLQETERLRVLTGARRGRVPAAGSAPGPPLPPPVSVAGSDQGPFDRLTDREADVLAGLVRRLSNKEIARELGITSATVKHHAVSLYGKLGVRSRREAERWAVGRGWRPPQGTKATG